MKLSGHISGLPEGASATITLTGDANLTTQTDAFGNYEFTVDAGSYMITPSLAGEEFSPPSISGTFSQDTILPSISDPPQVNKDLGMQASRRRNR